MTTAGQQHQSPVRRTPRNFPPEHRQTFKQWQIVPRQRKKLQLLAVRRQLSTQFVDELPEFLADHQILPFRFQFSRQFPGQFPVAQLTQSRMMQQQNHPGSISISQPFRR